MSDPQRHLFGHCQSAPGAKPDQYHGLCRVTYRSGFGVEHTCACPQHQKDADALVLQGSEHSDAVESGAQSGPESAVTDRGLATVSTTPKGA